MCSPGPTLREKIREALDAVRAPFKPEFGIILGTGLGALSASIRPELRVPYDRIPHFARPTVAGHKGELVLGTLEGHRVVAMEGRFHFYEGYTPEQITFPVRVMRAMGAAGLIVSNAAGGLNPSYARGDIMLIDDHINLMGFNPLVGPNDDDLGPRFPDMSRPYDPDFIKAASDAAASEGVTVRRGVYAALTGPSLETRAEYRYLRKIGADAVGMSTVPEVIAGVHAGFRILGISIITDMCIPEDLKPVDIREIIAVAAEAEPRMAAVLKGFLSRAPL